MTELIRYLTLVGLLFGVGLYGLLTRRTQTALFTSLGVIVGALALLLVVFNHTVRPSELSGYLFAGLLPLLAGAYAAALYPLINSKRQRDTLDLETSEERRIPARPLSLRNIITDLGSFSSQISLAMFFIIAYLLARVSLEAFGAFTLGVVGLKYILLKRMRERTKEPCGESQSVENNMPDKDSVSALR